MKLALKITPKAASDIKNGIDYYNGQQKGLGKQFGSVIKVTFGNIEKMPLVASIAYGDMRYKVVDKFLYVILYTIQGNFISIIRVFNTYQQSVY